MALVKFCIYIMQLMCKDKMYRSKKERGNYWEVLKDFYEHKIFFNDTLDNIKEEYVWNKENDKDEEIIK